MLAYLAGTGKLDKIGPCLQEQGCEVCTFMQGDGEKGIYGDDVYVGTFAVIGLGGRRGDEGKAFGLGKGEVCDGIGKKGLLRGLVKLDAIPFCGKYSGRYLFVHDRERIRKAGFEVTGKIGLPPQEIEREDAVIPD